MRASHLNKALVANEKIAAKTECLGLIVRVLCLILHFELRDLGSRKLSFVLFLVWFAVSEADSLVESQLCDIVFSNELFGVVSPFSTALFVPSGFSDSRFETAPDLSFQNTQRQCWQSGNQFQIKALGLATNKAFKRDSQRLAVLV
ncbi:hypothetical protein R7040_18365 [Vibrio sp. 1069]|uniref:hypothetical protein n=1 Tax=Vibrio TaxID=662 RepID=UPI0007A9EDED|nr:MULTISPECIES: hypothetical protein [Vibrio]KZC46997.1 hypothetical protein XM68_c11763 [Vibrio alginolyticus]MDW1763105.1 hypothetical protein [Vibrio sp. Vb2135]MDW2333059.1 hypothetical protein [Vibrio sp. 1069]